MYMIKNDRLLLQDENYLDQVIIGVVRAEVDYLDQLKPILRNFIGRLN